MKKNILEDYDATKKAIAKEKELYKNDSVYRYLTNQICSTSSEIRRTKEELKRLSDKQEELKRGRSALVELRRDLLLRKTKKTDALIAELEGVE